MVNDALLADRPCQTIVVSYASVSTAVDGLGTAGFFETVSIPMYSTDRIHATETTEYVYTKLCGMSHLPFFASAVSRNFVPVDGGLPGSFGSCYSQHIRFISQSNGRIHLDLQNQCYQNLLLPPLVSSLPLP